MTEQESPWSEEDRQDWCSTNDLKTRCGMVDDARYKADLPIQERKWRLFLVACLHRVWHHFEDERCRRMVHLIEERADELINNQQLQEQWDSLCFASGDAACKDPFKDPEECPERGEAACAVQALSYAVSVAVDCGDAAPAAEWVRSASEDEERERESLIHLLCDIFGNPYCVSRINPSWVAWDSGLVVRLAKRIYDERAFDRLPILADALEDSGCTDADILNHLRGPGPHVRGCWVVDLLLNKK